MAVAVGGGGRQWAVELWGTAVRACGFPRLGQSQKVLHERRRE